MSFMEVWIEMEDGAYPDGYPKSVYKHEACNAPKCKPVNNPYPFCPYCGDRITHKKLIDGSVKYIYE